MSPQEKKEWLQKAIATIIEDNLYHGVIGLWPDFDEDDYTHQEFEDKAEALQEAADNIRDHGCIL